MLSLAALLLFLTSATAVNFAGVRLSDISLATFCALILFISRRNKRRFLLPKQIIPIIFLLGAVLTSTLLQWLYAPESFITEGLNNSISIPFGIIVAFFVCAKMNAGDQMAILYRYNIIAIIICLGLYYYQYLHGVIGWIEIIDDTNRFTALSQNPNQLALYLLPIPFFAYVQVLVGKIRVQHAFLQIALALLINYFAIGKGLLVAWLIGSIVIGLLGARGYLDTKRLLIKSAIIVVLLPLLYFLMSPFIDALYTGDAPGSVEGQGDVRIQLWINGLRAWLDAPIFGHGPGHYSGLGFAYEGIESHNLMIDWLSAYGVVGGVALLAVFSSLIGRAFKENSWIILGFYLCLLTQSMFHFYGRQPVYWIWWAVGLTASGVLVRKKDIKCAG